MSPNLCEVIMLGNVSKRCEKLIVVKNKNKNINQKEPTTSSHDC